MSNSDLASRREARKRRILENSEKRLTKIISCDKFGDTNLDSGVHAFETDWKHRNGVTTQNNVECIDAFFQSDNVNQLHSEQGVVDEEILPSQKEDFKENSLIENLLNAKAPEDKTQSLLWVDCLFIIILSFLVRLMYEYNLSYLFGESLLIPFITITVAKIAANPTKRNSNLAMCGSIIKASLLLSGVPNLWLDNIFNFVQMVVDISNDFALYLFSFTISHIFLESFVIR